MKVGELETYRKKMHKIIKRTIDKDCEEYKGVKHKSKYMYRNEQLGYIGLMCPYCFYSVKVRVSNRLESIIKHDAEGDDAPVVDVFIPVSYRVFECPSCKREYVHMIDIDVNIVDIISILNKKGYRTKYCCEGHGIDDKPYIYFTSNAILKHLDTLPLSWFHDRKEINKGDFINKSVIIRSEYYKSGEHLFELKEWAESLPINTDIKINNSNFY